MAMEISFPGGKKVDAVFKGFTIKTDQRMEVSERVHGTLGFDEWLLRYHGNSIRSPLNPKYASNPEYLEWHNREVFKGPSRPIPAVE